MIDFFIASYMLIDYLMAEKESMERTKKWLTQERDSRERKSLKELAEWHHQNFLRFLMRPPEWIPGCVKQYLLGFRERPDPKEIQEEYARRREHFKEKEKIRIKIALAFAAAAVLYILFKLR